MACVVTFLRYDVQPSHSTTKKTPQWTGEKIGKSPKTRMDEDFNTLTDETEAKRVALEKLNETSQAYLKAISKLDCKSLLSFLALAKRVSFSRLFGMRSIVNGRKAQ